MVGRHHQFNGCELGQTPGDGEGQGGLTAVLQSMGLQRVRHDLVTKQQQFHLHSPAVLLILYLQNTYLY